MIRGELVWSDQTKGIHIPPLPLPSCTGCIRCCGVVPGTGEDEAARRVAVHDKTVLPRSCRTLPQRAHDLIVFQGLARA